MNGCMACMRTQWRYRAIVRANVQDSWVGGPCCANKQEGLSDAAPGGVGLKAHSGIRLHDQLATPAERETSPPGAYTTQFAVHATPETKPPSTLCTRR